MPVAMVVVGKNQVHFVSAHICVLFDYPVVIACYPVTGQATFAREKHFYCYFFEAIEHMAQFSRNCEEYLSVNELSLMTHLEDIWNNSL